MHAALLTQENAPCNHTNHYFWHMLRSLFFIMLLGPLLSLYSQKVSPRDSSLSVFTISASGGVMFPVGNFADRYGPVWAIGGDIRHKFKSNLLVGGSAHFLFGSEPTETQLLSNILPLIAGDGIFPGIEVAFRGLAFQGTIGKIFPFPRFINPNSGISVQLGFGYTEYQNRIHVVSGFTPQLEGDYLRGYDRLSAGLLSSQSVGYTHFSNNKTINFYVHLEFTQFIVKYLRGYQYDIGPVGSDYRMDWTIGLRAGWIIPFYPKNKYRNIEFR